MSGLGRIFAVVLVVAGALVPSAIRAAEETPQRATREDMKLFEHKIGTFRSPTYLFDDGKTEHYFTIGYEWFDRDKTIVKVDVRTVIPSQSRTIVNSEAFYWHDPVKQQILVFGAFARGMVGSGAVGTFDHDAGTHTVWATSIDVKGTAMHVRDMFQAIDKNSWKNKTWVRMGDETEWKVVHEAVYTRVN